MSFGRPMTFLLAVKFAPGLDSHILEILTHLLGDRLDLASQENPFSDRRAHNWPKYPADEWGGGFHDGDRRRSQDKHCRPRSDEM
jgi:hypothetical protein